MNVYSPPAAISPNDIAVVGMSLRAPGAGDVESFWSNIRNGVESVRDLTAEEVASAAADGAPVDDPHYVRRTADVADMEMFDADFFGLSPKEAAIMDPQHRQFLECAWEAMEDAGHTPDTIPGPVGVFAGCGMGSYFYFNVCSNRQLVEQVGMFLLRHNGNDKDFLATRVSFSFDLRGPSVNVQTACSTSLVAAHYACQSLISGECDMALAGGVTIEFPHRRGYLFQEGEILSPDGHCRPFDHRAGGTVFGSGAGVIVLRRLADAIADGDRIHAVIKGSAVNNDGAGKAGYLAPSVNGQAEAIIEAQGLAGIDAETIDYVECHGTGTALGDPIEIEALTQAFRQNTDRRGFCAVGSVKSNIGHLDTAAGVVSLIKVALSLKHGEIPPSLGFEAPNPAIAFDASPFFVNSGLRPWPMAGRPRRAAVNSLGVGGTNAHMILEEAPHRPIDPQGERVDEKAMLITLSAKQPKALDDMAARLGAALTSQPGLALRDAVHTLHAGRRQFEHRRVVAVRDRDDAVQSLTQSDASHTFTHRRVDGAGEVVFLFPGGGAQHPGMARDLYERDTDFRAHVDEGLGYLPAEAEAEIREIWLGRSLSHDDARQRFLLPSRQLPAILIVEVALARLWMQRGIRPSALIGHSMGENAAACIAGVLSYRDAVGLVHLRGRLFDTVEPGGMLSVAADAETVRNLILPELDLASVNAPQLCVVSGRNADLQRFGGLLAAQNIDATRVPIDIAAHSRMLDGILAPFEAYLRGISLRAPTIPIISNRDGLPLSAADAIDPAYWTAHLRSTVEFAKGLSTLAEDDRRIYVEVGPGRTMSSLAKGQGTIDANRVINSLPHPDDTCDDHLHFLAALGRSWAVGLNPDLSDLVTRLGARRVSLPTYPFQRRRYFIEPAREAFDSVRRDLPLEKIANIEDWGYRRDWKRSVPDCSPDAATDASSWLVFLDEAGHGEKLTARLRGLGHTVATVALGDAFAVRGRDEFVLCPEDGRAGYDALVSALGERGDFPRRIVHLWLLTQSRSFRPGSSFVQRNQECGFYCLLHLSQAMSDADEGHDLHLAVATNGLQRVADEPVPFPEKATILGPALVIPRELEGSFVRVVDFAVAEAAEQGRTWRRRAPVASLVDDQLWDEIFAQPSSEAVAWRGDRRWTQCTTRLPLKPALASAAGLRQEGVYLFTGGLADLSLALARSLADELHARLALVGRTELPDRAGWPLWKRVLPRDNRIRRAIDAIEDLETRGAQVAYFKADVADPEAMAAVIRKARERFGRIDGVFHAAGVVDDALMQAKTSESIDGVLAPKLYGTAVLDEVLAREPVELVVLFSSTSTDTAPAGQVDYIAANAYLNAYAESRAGDGNRRTVALHWGVWNEVGMAARAVAGSPQRAGETIMAQRPDDPFFERWVEDEAGVAWLETSIAPASHWMLDEHRLTSGQPILPGTAYVDIILRAAVAYGLPATGHLTDLVFLRPLIVPDGETRTLRVGFRPAGDGFQVSVLASGKHAEAHYDPRPQASHPSASIVELERRCTDRRVAADGSSLRAIQEGHVRFGPRWGVLRRLALGPDAAVAQIELAPRFRDDLEAGSIAHPALLDIATGCAMELVPGYDPDETLWAPASYGALTLHRPLPAKFTSIVRLADSADLGAGYAAFDIAIVDADGVTVLEVDDFVVKKLDSDLGFADHGEKVEPAPRAYAVPAAATPLAAQVRAGITPAEGFDALVRALAAKVVQPIVSSIDLDLLRERAAKPAVPQKAEANLFDRPELDEAYVAPRNDIEATLAEFWRELLGVERVGIHDSFFDIGGHSLIAVRLFRMIRNRFGVDLPMSVLFEAPTIAACATLLATHGVAEAGEAQPVAAAPAASAKHLVALRVDAKQRSATPLFICAGMFGNVLNLRQLALHVGRDRPVYALQARGLFGGAEPHETFEEMARDYIAEMRTVQPTGPYLLAGFSGGGITAYEMARQLVAEGEEVARLIMLDTPLPTQPALSRRDRASMKIQDIRRHGLGFVRQWVGNKIDWAAKQRQLAGQGDHASSSEDFHNGSIEAAFYRALQRYEPGPYDGAVALYRPRPSVYYTLSGGRRLQSGRNLIRDDNGWSPLVPDLAVTEVPGDHDSMVLEPCVRVLADRMRAELSKDRSQVHQPIAAE